MRAVASVAAALVALGASGVPQLLVGLVALYIGIAVLGGPMTALRLLGATFAMAGPLALVHGLVNPAYAVSHDVLGLPLREEGLRYSIALAGRLGLLFGILGFWLGTKRRTWVAIVAATRLPPAWSVAILQAVTLTHVLGLRVARIRQAQRSRGILRDDMGVLQRAGAAAAVVVPLIAGTLIDARERDELLHRMGFGAYALKPPVPLAPPGRIDVVLSIGIGAATLAVLAV